MLGKQKCKILKEIRQKIADENDIPYVTRECTHQGACKGTCPRCESELRYLEQQLAARQALGKKVAVAALCAGLAFGAAGCGPSEEPEPTPEPTPVWGDVAGYIEEPLEGETSLDPNEPLEGEPTWCPDPEDDPEEYELEGDVMYVPEGENGND